MGLTVVVDQWGRPRVRFPYVLGDNVAWNQDRLVGDGDPKWKWLAPTGSRPTLYNANALRLAHQWGGVWVLEGPTDVLALLSTFDTPAAVGVPGVGNFRREWVPAFEGLSAVFVVADADEAGNRLRARLDELLGPVVGTLLHVRVPAEHNDLDAWRRACACDNERFSIALLGAVMAAQSVADQSMAS